MVHSGRDSSAAVFKAIADPTRREILGLLREGGRSVGEVAAQFSASRPAISRHLRLLRAAGLVTTRERGTVRICELNAVPLRAVDHWLRAYETFWDQNLRHLNHFVEDNP